MEMPRQSATRIRPSTSWLPSASLPKAAPRRRGVVSLAHVRFASLPAGATRAPPASGETSQGTYFFRSAAVFMHFSGACSAFTASHLMVRVLPS